METTTANITNGLQAAWNSVLFFTPRLVAFLLILAVGYFVARAVGALVDKALERMGFDHMVERGGIKAALEKSGYDVSDILGKIAFYTVFLFVLQMAFGAFGPNPISELLTRVIAFLPNIFVAIAIVVIAASIGAAVREVVRAALGGLSYGRALANIASAAIVVVGVFAALNQLGIAPEIVNGLFYAVLAVVVGSAIVAVGGGGIIPMRAQWEKALNKIEQEAPRMAQEAQRNAAAQQYGTAPAGRPAVGAAAVYDTGEPVATSPSSDRAI